MVTPTGEVALFKIVPKRPEIRRSLSSYVPMCVLVLCTSNQPRCKALNVYPVQKWAMTLRWQSLVIRPRHCL